MGGFTKVPNEILDAIGELQPAAFKLAIALCRLTYGYHRNSVVMSLPEIQAMTNLSKQGVLNAASQISQFFTKERQGNNVVWKVNSIDREKSNELTKEVEEVKSVDQTSQLSVPTTSGLKKTIKKEDSVTNVTVADGAATSQPALFDLPEPPAEGKSNGKGKGRKTDPEAAEKTKELLKLYGEALGCEIPSYPQEGAAARRILKNYTAEDAIGCYRWLKADKFWHGKHLSLASVNKQLGEWVKLGRPSPNGANGKANGNGRDRLWLNDFVAYLNGNKTFDELNPLVQESIRDQGESNVKRQPIGVTKNQFNTLWEARH